MKRIPHDCEAFAGKFKVGYRDLTAKEYVSEHLKFKKIYGRIADKVASLSNQGDFLEVGAGGGVLACLIANRNKEVRITASDLSPDMVAVGTEYIQDMKYADRIKYIHSGGDTLDLGDKKFDVIYSSFSFNYWKNPEKVILNMLKHLKKDGTIYVTEFRREWWINLVPGFLLKDVPIIQAGYTPAEVGIMLKKLGVNHYKVEKVSPVSLAFTIYNRSN